MMRRKLLIALGAAVLGPWAAHGQSKPAPVLIGWLNMSSRETGGHWLAAFKEGLAVLGWKEGAQIAIEERWADGLIGRLPALAEELAAMKPALIVAAPSQSVAAAAKAAPTTPIVHATGSDPVFAGFAASLARPGGMITGLSNVVGEVTEKYLELLLAVAPKLRRIGFLADSTAFARLPLMEAAKRSVAQRAVEARFVEVARPDEIEPAISRLAKEGAQALVAMPSPLFNNERRRIVKLALARRWPMVSSSREWAEEGALLSYGVDPSGTTAAPPTTWTAS